MVVVMVVVYNVKTHPWLVVQVVRLNHHPHLLRCNHNNNKTYYDDVLVL
jgi:hypothetical protein